MASQKTWTHLVRFIAEEDGQVHLGNIDAEKYPDVGLSTYNGDKVQATLVSGSAFSGVVTDKVMTIKQVMPAPGFSSPSQVVFRTR